MKFDRNILEKLVETNAEAYNLLHYQYTALDSRYASLENEYREIVRRTQESNLVPLDTFNEVKDAYSHAALLLSQAQQEMENLQAANASFDGVVKRNRELVDEVEELKRSYKVSSDETKKEFANNQQIHKLMKEAQEKQQDAEHNARYWQAKYEDIQSKLLN